MKVYRPTTQLGRWLSASLSLLLLSTSSLSAIQLHHLSKQEREDTIRFLSANNGARIWVHNSGHSQACTIDFRYPSTVYLQGRYLVKSNTSKFLPMCPIECVRKDGSNVCPP